jgi:hypothetical protein
VIFYTPWADFALKPKSSFVGFPGFSFFQITFKKKNREKITVVIFYTPWGDFALKPKSSFVGVSGFSFFKIT